MRTKRKPKKTGIEVRGEVVTRKLSTVNPNPWNPNVMTDEMKESLLYGLRRDGWLASQSLLVWGTDEKGKRHNLIIDGEHRWSAATGDGLESGPMVFLDGIPQAEAMALTIKMNQKRGEWDPNLLSGVIKELDTSLDTDDLALDLGLSDGFVMKLLSDDPTDLSGNAGGDHKAEEQQSSNANTMRGASDHVRLTQLFFDKAQHTEFLDTIKVLSTKWGTKNVTETALRAVLECADAK